jgi:phosphate transport system permease protein
MRKEIEAEVKTEYPEGVLTFHAWLNEKFLGRSMSSQAQLAGVRSALKGSVLMILITIVIAFPIGIAAAIYLEEYADPARRINRIIQTNIDNLSGVPSIVYGILGLAIFVRSLEAFTSGAIFGIQGGNGRTILSAGLTLALLILPMLISMVKKLFERFRIAYVWLVMELVQLNGRQYGSMCCPKLCREF